MKVLYITNKPIYPKIDGGCVAMDKFLQCLLHKDISVKHLLIHTDKHPFSQGDYPDELIKKTQPEGVFINTQITASGAVSHLFKRGSYNVDRFFSNQMAALIEKELKSDDFTIVILESLFCTPYLSTIRSHFSGKVFVRTHNVETNIWQGLSESCDGIARRQYLKKLTKDLRRYEMEVLQKVDGILALSHDDAQHFTAMGIQTASAVIPVAIEIKGEALNNGANSNFYHLGVMNWQPNIEAVQRLVRLFPSIKEKIPSAELYIAGKGSKELIEEDKGAGICVKGFVDDIDSFACNAGILVSPILSGSGVRIKLLEAMALGIPSVTTTVGAQGINYTETKCVLVSDTDEEIVQNCIELATNRELREEIGKNARDYIQKNHTIESISSKIIEFIKNT